MKKNLRTVGQFQIVMCITRISKGEEREKGTEKYLKSLEQELSKLMTDSTPHIQEAQRTQNKII